MLTVVKTDFSEPADKVVNRTSIGIGSRRDDHVMPFVFWYEAPMPFGSFLYLESLCFGCGLDLLEIVHAARTSAHALGSTDLV